MTVFIGELDNHKFVAAQSLAPAEQHKLTKAMLEVAPHEGYTKLPVFNAAGWAIHATAPEMTADQVADTIAAMVPQETVQVVDADPDTLRQEMEQFIGGELIERAFERPAKIPEAFAPAVLSVR